MTRGRILCFLVMTAALLPPLGEQGAEAAFPGADGRLAFTQEAPAGDHTQSDIYTVNPDGSGLVRLSASANQNEFGPAYNPAGTLIAFWRTPAPFGPGSLWVMNADGSAKRQLTTGIDARDPAWDPTGTRLAYTGPGVGSFDIWTLRAADGQDRHRVTSGAATDFEPAWSPTGSQIAFTRGFEQGDAGDVYVVAPAGGTATPVTSSPAYDHQAAWAPGAGRLTFERDFDHSSSIFVVRADGSNLVRLTTGQAFDTGPAFSPRGTRIAFGTDRGGSTFPRPLAHAPGRRQRPPAGRPAVRERLPGLAGAGRLSRAQPAASITREAARKSSRPASVSGGQATNPAAGRVDAGERAPGEPAAAQVGGGLVGVAGDPVEQHPVRLRRHQAASAGARTAAAGAGEVAEDRANVEEHQPGERKALGGGDERETVVADGERLAVLGADVRVGDRLAGGRVGGVEQRSRPASAQVARSPLAASAVPSSARITQPRRSSDIAARRATATSASAALGARVAVGSGISATIAAVSLERASWLAVVAICVIAAILLAISGYSGYSIVVTAVGASAAINLL